MNSTKNHIKRLMMLTFLVLILMTLYRPLLVSAASRPGRPKITSLKYTGYNSVTIKWKKVKNADRYEVYCSRDGKGFKLIKKVKGRTYTHKKLKLAHSYRYKLRAVKGKKKSRYSAVKKINLPRYVNIKEFCDELLDCDGFTVEKTIGGKEYSFEVCDDIADFDYGYILSSASGNVNEESYTDYLDIEVSPANWRNKTILVIYRHNNWGRNETQDECEATISIGKYQRSQEIPFVMVEVDAITTADARKQFFKAGNKMFRESLPHWSEMLNKEFGVSLYNLGFNLGKDF